VIRLLIVLVFVSLVLRGIVRLVRGVAEGLQGPPAPRPPKAVPLVRDPVCGTYVVPSTALSSGAGSQTKFFCSENCRRTYGMKIAQ
jgi:YHS domain-containing protein